MECELCGDALDYKRSTCVDCLAKNIYEKKKTLSKHRDECLPLKEHIKAAVDRTRQASKQNINADLRVGRIQQLREQLERAKRKTAEDRQKVAQMRAKLKERRAILQDEREQFTRRVSQHTPPAPTEGLTLLCQQRTLELATRRRTLIGELLSFFPVNPNSETETTRIISLILPNSGVYNKLPPELLSAALGYVAHFVHLVTCYLGVPSPYAIEFAGSRSSMRTTHDPPRRFPLYGTRHSDMEVGVKLLNSNIVALCYSQGIKIPKTMFMRTLPNLMLLLRAPALGWSGPRDVDEYKHPHPPKQLPPVRVQQPTVRPGEEEEVERHTQHVAPKKQVIRKSKDEEEDFIMVDNTAVPTPSQAEDLAQFERALFTDSSGS